MKHCFEFHGTGVIEATGTGLKITIDRTETNIELPPGFLEKTARFKSEDGMRLSDVVLEAALVLSKQEGMSEFTAADLLHVAERRHPGINKRSFWSRVISTAPGHPSAKHFRVTHRYLRYMGEGRYVLEPKSVITSEPNYEEGMIDESLWGDEKIKFSESSRLDS